MVRKQGSSESKLALRNASEPYTILLTGKPYILSSSDLNSQIDVPLQRKREWYYPDIKVLSFVDDTLTLALTHQKGLLKMTVKIEPNKLHVACSCGLQVQTVCLHIYKALDRIILYQNTNYFEKYSPGGSVEIATKYPKYFDKNVYATGISYKPKPNIGTIYRLSDGIDFKLPTVTHVLPGSNAGSTIRDTEICFAIIASYRRERLPALIACAGLLNKAGNDLKSFQNFISGIELAQAPVSTGDQKQLNFLGLELWKIVTTIPGRIKEIADDQLPSLIKLFQTWEQALPMLNEQKFIYRYRVNRQSDLKGKPDKQNMIRVNLSMDRPILKFTLQDKRDYYQFSPVLMIRGTHYYKFDLRLPLFAIIESDCYLLNSLLDSAVLEWIYSLNGKIIVFKEHFQEFNEHILSQLRKRYTIE